MDKKFKVNAIITAGGTSSRFGIKNKLLEKVNGKEIIKHTVDAFEMSEVDKIIISANATIKEDLEKSFKDYKKVVIIEGGSTRQQSVYNAIQFDVCDYVLIHDGARPMVFVDTINQAIEMTIEKQAMTVVTKTIDTIKEVENGKIVRTIDREKLYNTQTPQGFEYNLIRLAHQKLEGDNFTDDAGMIESLGKDVYTLIGSCKNFKVTTIEDIEIAKIYLGEIV